MSHTSIKYALTLALVAVCIAALAIFVTRETFFISQTPASSVSETVNAPVVATSTQPTSQPTGSVISPENCYTYVNPNTPNPATYQVESACKERDITPEGRLVFYDDADNRSVVLEEINKVAAQQLGKESIVLMLALPSAQHGNLYFNSIDSFGSDSPWTHLYRYDITTKTFSFMNLSNALPVYERYFSPRYTWVAGFKTQQRDDVDRGEVLYVFDLAKDALVKEIRLDGDDLTFMKTCSNVIVDKCQGADITWIDDTTIEYGVYLTRFPVETELQTDFQFVEKRRATISEVQ